MYPDYNPSVMTIISFKDPPAIAMKPVFCFLCFITFFLSGCSKLPEQPTVTPSVPFATNTFTPETVTSPPQPTSTPLPMSTPTLDPASGFTVSSPLQDVQINELASIVSSPFSLIGPERDEGHHGTDFAYWSRGSHATMSGLPIHSVLNGRVVAVISGINPYGNLIIIETPINNIPPDMLLHLSPPIQQTPYPYNPRMQYCPDLKDQSWTVTPGSLYLLYGHMLEPSPLKIGDKVNSGNTIGMVGTTGMSVNPHLHLEMRWGQSGTEFASMNYYSTGATHEEMNAYCEWRISGKFTLLDPMKFFEAWQSFSSK